MIKITEKYMDFNDVERTEDFYFNLTEAELMEMELSISGGLGETIQRIVAAQDAPAIIKIFKDLVLRAYGVKSADGRLHIKNDQVREDFMHTQAYSNIFMRLATDADEASKFVNGIMPKNINNGSSIPAPAAKKNQK